MKILSTILLASALALSLQAFSMEEEMANLDAEFDSDDKVVHQTPSVSQKVIETPVQNIKKESQAIILEKTPIKPQIEKPKKLIEPVYHQAIIEIPNKKISIEAQPKVIVVDTISKPTQERAILSVTQEKKVIKQAPSKEVVTKENISVINNNTKIQVKTTLSQETKVYPKEVIKTSFINQSNYENSSMDEIKAILLKKAKEDAATEIFGDFVKSDTEIQNGKLLKDVITSEKNGIVHVKGTPKYANGKNFGDIQVTITAYATDEDIASMQAHKIILNDYVYTNPSMPLKDLKRAAEDAFLVEAIAKKKPEIKKSHNVQSLARKYAKAITIKNIHFDVKSVSYIISGEVDYIPYFLSIN